MSKDKMRNRLLRGIFELGIRKPIKNLTEQLSGGREGDLGQWEPIEMTGLNPRREEEEYIMQIRASEKARAEYVAREQPHRRFGGIKMSGPDNDVDVY